jgi:NAD(P)-dependent dehydrogenase (short-subunit alcohol dehydrogenase family)
VTHTWLITGANRGIGLEFARQLSEAGETVIATARNPERADALRALAAAQPGLSIETLDLEDPASIVALAASTPGWRGRRIRWVSRRFLARRVALSQRARRRY